MSANILLAPLLWGHAIAATVWLGGTLVCMLTAPLVASTSTDARLVWRPFREALRVGIGVFVVTGALMAAQRFASATLPPTYYGLLVLKVGLGIWMFSIARRIGTAPRTLGDNARLRTPEGQVLALGAIIYGLAIALRTIYESSITA